MHVVMLTGDQLSVLRLLVRAEISRTIELQDRAMTLPALDLAHKKERDMRTLAALLVLA